jgi:anthrone oxygenase-like protein
MEDGLCSRVCHAGDPGDCRLVLDAIAWWQMGKLAFLAGAFLMLVNWPWTLFVIMPTNQILMAADLDRAGPETRALIVKWNRLHLVRTMFGALAVLAFLVALSG